jgi:hypothetical protein
MGALVFWLGVGILLALVLLAARTVETGVEGTPCGTAGRCPTTPGSTGATRWPATAAVT